MLSVVMHTDNGSFFLFVFVRDFLQWLSIVYCTRITEVVLFVFVRINLCSLARSNSRSLCHYNRSFSLGLCAEFVFFDSSDVSLFSKRMKCSRGLCVRAHSYEWRTNAPGNVRRPCNLFTLYHHSSFIRYSHLRYLSKDVHVYSLALIHVEALL